MAVEHKLYMTESNETPIGAVRTDYTEKPEATVLRAFAAICAESLHEHLRDPQLPVDRDRHVASRAVLSARGFPSGSTANAVRALAYDVHLPAYVIAENQIEKLGSPKARHPAFPASA